MANKRQLKKFIRNTCGALAAEMLLARAAFPNIDRKETFNVISDAAALQTRTLSALNIVFDKDRKEFETEAAFRKARSRYYATAYDALLDKFDKSVVEIVKKMNAMLPEDVRKAFKEAAAE